MRVKKRTTSSSKTGYWMGTHTQSTFRDSRTHSTNVKLTKKGPLYNRGITISKPNPVRGNVDTGFSQHAHSSSTYGVNGVKVGALAATAGVGAYQAHKFQQRRKAKRI